MKIKPFLSILSQLLCVFIICCGLSCKTTKAIKDAPLFLDKEKSIVFCDSLKSADLIITDNTDDIFGKMTVTDMSIQMKRNFNSDYSTADITNDYLTYVQKDVTSFSPSDMEFVQAAMEKAFTLCQKISPSIFPKQINLIKTKSRNYGDGVYFTRENCIIIPANVLREKKADDFLGTMLHEIFHVYSRLNPTKRTALYELIGFRHVNEAAAFEIPEPLKSQILLNPDGTDFKYYITLQTAPDKEIKAIPIIYSNSAKFNAKKPDFFNYLKFELFEIQNMARGFIVATKKDGSSTLNMKELPDFNRQIRDNTGYIIHPDEILADNFMFLALAQKDKSRNDKFSNEGKELLRLLEIELKR
jgi:hypothetical protein